LNDDQSVTYAPPADYAGTDAFTYTVSDDHGGGGAATVTVTMTPVNDVPVAGGDEAATDEDVPVTVAVLDNDGDVDGDALSVVLGALPSRGTATVGAGGSITYTPRPNAFGTDTFTYVLDDGKGGKATAPVNVTIRPVNDPPVLSDDIRTVDEDQVLEANVLTNDVDVDGDPLSVTIATPPGHGSAKVTPERTIVYAPDPDYNGSDSFVYQVDDGQGGTATATVSVTVAPVNDLPVGIPDAFERRSSDRELTVAGPGVLGNDSDPEGDGLTAQLYSGTPNGRVAMRPDGSFVYTPNPTHRGGDEFFYRAFDGTGYSEPIRVIITVRDCLSDPPRGLDLTEYLHYLLCLVDRTVDNLIQVDAE
jgi:hypothetical protein